MFSVLVVIVCLGTGFSTAFSWRFSLAFGESGKILKVQKIEKSATHNIHAYRKNCRKLKIQRLRVKNREIKSECVVTSIIIVDF